MFCKQYSSMIPLLAIVALLVTPVGAIQAGRTLKQSIEIDASIGEVWSLFSNEEGLKKWMAPLIELDLRVGGTIKSNYHADGVIGDENTITNTILAYEPLRMLSLKATKPPADFVYADAIKDTWSVLYFETLGKDRTRVRIHGLGYRETPDSEAMFKFFERGNEWVLQQLKKAAEEITTPDAVLGDVELDRILADAAGMADASRSIEKEVGIEPEPLKHYVYYVYPVKEGFFRGEISEEDQKAFAGHVQHIKRLLAESRLILAGPSFDPVIYPDSKDTMISLEMPAPGIVIFRARDDAEAKAIMESDPAVAAGVFKARLNQFTLSFMRP